MNSLRNIHLAAIVAGAPALAIAFGGIATAQEQGFVPPIPGPYQVFAAPAPMPVPAPVAPIVPAAPQANAAGGYHAPAGGMKLPYWMQPQTSHPAQTLTNAAPVAATPANPSLATSVIAPTAPQAAKPAIARAPAAAPAAAAAPARAAPAPVQQAHTPPRPMAGQPQGYGQRIAPGAAFPGYGGWSPYPAQQQQQQAAGGQQQYRQPMYQQQPTYPYGQPQQGWPAPQFGQQYGQPVQGWGQPWGWGAPATTAPRQGGN